MRRLALVAGMAVLAVSLAVGGPAFAATAVEPITYYVDDDAAGANDGTSWENAFADLQSALALAVAGDSIWVAAGTYKPSVSLDGSADARTAAFTLKSGVALYGGFTGVENQLQQRSADPALTILSGDIGVTGDPADNSYHVVYASGVTGAVLDGFTVTGGCGDRVGSLRDTRGAGMYTERSLLTVSDCVFSGNLVNGKTWESIACGAGMYSHDSAPTVAGCSFTGNQAGGTFGSNAWGQGGGMYVDGSYSNQDRPLITGCTFTANNALSRGVGNGGGGMFNGPGSTATVEDCAFTGNSAGNGGAMANVASMPTLSNCVFTANFTTYADGRGGAICNQASPTIVNCTFYKNGWRLLGYGEPLYRPYTAVGGAIYYERTGGNLINCIFSDNAVRAGGGALYYTGGRGGSLINCLFFENISWDAGHTPPEVDHIRGPFPMAFTEYGNLYDLDPLFLDAAAGDFHLSYGSPCVDAGENVKHGNVSWPILPEFDFDGDKRVVDGDAEGEGDDAGKPAVDIGADEYVPDLPGLGAFLTALSDAGTIDATVAVRLLGYVAIAEAALAEEREADAVAALGELIADVRASLGESEVAHLIEMRAQAVIQEI